MINPIIENFQNNFLKSMIYKNDSIGGHYLDLIAVSNINLIDIKNKFNNNFIDLSDNDYFCLRNLPMNNDSLDLYEFENLQSEIFRNATNSPHNDLRVILKGLLNSKQIFFTTSGYVANINILISLLDANTPVYGDAKMHYSWYTAFFAARGQQVSESIQTHKSFNLHTFSHNNAKHLEKMLKNYGSGVVIIESVYSVEGDILNLEIIEVAKKYNCIILLDESHSIGGVVTNNFSFNQEYNIGADIITFSLSKALASNGGVISIQNEFINRFINYDNKSTYETEKLILDTINLSPLLVFTNSLSGTKICLQRILLLLGRENHRAKIIQETSQLIKQSLSKLNIKIPSNSPIIFLEIGTADIACKFRDNLLENGILGSLYVHPATSHKRSGVRFILNYEFCINDTKINNFISVINNEYHKILDKA
jgi:CAI-1 autoinducer synthase